jgi:ribokinase
VTAVLVAPDGRSTNYGWRNGDVIRRTEDELDRLRPLIAGADAVLVTFEPSAAEVEWALRTVAESDPKPLLLLQPSPRMEAPQQIHEYLRYVDYLVGSEQDLRELAGPADGDLSLNEVAGRLFNAGAGVICAVDNLTCQVRADKFFTTVSAPEALIREAPAARERFIAALIRQLIKFGPELTDEKLRWAAAAMAVNNRVDSITDSMPAPADVDELLQATTSWKEENSVAGQHGRASAGPGGR